MKTILPFPIICFRCMLSVLVSFFMMQTGIARDDTEIPPSDKPRNGLPPGWEYQTNTTNPHGIIVLLDANPRINNIPINPGDYIGAFYTDDYGELQCGGADFWQGDANIIFPAYQDDFSTPEKDGFGYAEVMHFKIFSWTTQKEYTVDLLAWDPTFPTTNKWFPLGLSSCMNMACFVDFDAYATATPNPVCIGETVDLAAQIFVGTTGNYTYSWWSEPPGFNSRQQNPSDIPLETTTYYLEVFDGTLYSSHQVQVIVNEYPIAATGPDATICEGEPVQVSASAANYSGVEWSSSGDGTFDNNTAFTTIYEPGPQDIEAGEAVLTFTAFPLDPCQSTASDELSITILPLPSVSLPAIMEVCETQEIWLTANASDFVSIEWVTDGDGTFSNPNATTTQYFPGQLDLNTGELNITACVEGGSPCFGSDCATIYMTISDAATTNAPNSRTKCESDPVPLNSVAFNYSYTLWTTEGDGTFANAGALNTTYYPGEQDKENGGTLVTINAYGNGACVNFPATKDVQVILLPLPDVDAGDMQLLCYGYNLPLNAAVSNYTSVNWSTSGDGTFGNPSSPNTTYFPGNNDYNSGYFELTITAQPVTPCVLSVSDVLEITVVEQPVAEILTPSGQQLCEEQSLQLGAQAGDFVALEWESTGDGYFDDPASLNPVYYHGPVSDLSGQPVTISVTAFAAPNCGPDATDQLSVSFNPIPEVFSGPDMAICETGGQLSASAENYSALQWESTGDGYFSNPGILNPVYFPGPGDIGQGVVSICLYAAGIGNCDDVSDCLQLNIIQEPFIDIIPDSETICWEEVYVFEDVIAENYDDLLWFTVNGGGDFSDENAVHPTYFPSPLIDYPQGCITIGIIAAAISPCELAEEDFMDLCFQAPPEAEAGNDVTITEGEPVLLNGFTGDASGSIWQTSGDGIFGNPFSAITEYFPGDEDIQNESAELTLVAFPLEGCPLPVSDQVQLTIRRMQVITLPQGWSAFSSFVDPLNHDFEAVMAPLNNSLIFAQNMNQVYWPSYGINTIGDFSNTDGYIVKMESAESLTVTGTRYAQGNIQIPEGWSILPVLSECPVSYVSLIGQLQQKLIIVTEIAGTNIIWPEQGVFSLQWLQPGKAYMIKLSEQRTFNFPDCN